MDVTTERLALRRASPHTVVAYTQWVRRYVRFHGGRHPRALGEAELTAFLSHLAIGRGVAASTQNQALAALDHVARPAGFVAGAHRPATGLPLAEAPEFR
ncbi:MAG: site-specific integrase [Gemmatimonadota bacterium]